MKSMNKSKSYCGGTLIVLKDSLSNSRWPFTAHVILVHHTDSDTFHIFKCRVNHDVFDEMGFERLPSQNSSPELWKYNEELILALAMSI